MGERRQSATVDPEAQAEALEKARAEVDGWQGMLDAITLLQETYPEVYAEAVALLEPKLKAALESVARAEKAAPAPAAAGKDGE